VTLYDIYEGCRFPVDPLKSLYPVVARLMGVEPFLCDDYFLHLLPPLLVKLAEKFPRFAENLEFAKNVNGHDPKPD
jgi:hypothetical protein